jgi:DNA primase
MGLCHVRPVMGLDTSKFHRRKRTRRKMVNFKEKALKAPIVELYEGELRSSGRALIGVCPLHDDTNPSFAIYVDTNSFYCFACGVGGDVISYFQKVKGVDFKTAIKELAGFSK